MLKPCPRCEETLLASPGQIVDIADAMPIAPSLRVEDTVYRKRLLRCAACDDLREGVLCARCGCYVSIRARSKKSRCPHPAADQWGLAEAPT